MEKAARRMIVLANSQEPIVLVPVILEPVEVQVPVAVAAPEIRNVAVAIPVLPDRTVLCNVSPIALPLEYSKDCIEFGI